MNRKLPVILFVLMLTASVVAAQSDSTKEKGFLKENLFTGGSVSLSFGSGTFGGGISPVFGYSVTSWLDAGIALNYFYISQRYNSVIKLRQSTYGAGPIVRVFPVNFIFLQGQFEHNIIAYKEFYSDGTPDYKESHNANSLLVGAGYTTGRPKGGGGSFAYLSVLFDVLDDPQSPYNTYSNGQRSRVPVVRAGFHIALFQGKNKYDR